jgi:WD40 repeat protein
MKPKLWTMLLISCSLLAQAWFQNAAAQQARHETRPRQLWAIIVGVGAPHDPGVRAQSGPETVRQALDVLAWLGGMAGWDRSHLLLLTDLGGNENPGTSRRPAPNITPSRKNLDWAFQEWLASRARPGDIIVFYFAGQSRVLVPVNPLDAPEYYLLPTDVHLGDLPARGWSLDRALDGFARQGKYQMVCWLATALQAQQAEGDRNVSPADLIRLSRDWLRRLVRWPAVTAWLAADRPSLLGTSGPSVPFTTALLAGLGDKTRKPNLASCLQSLHRDSRLKLGGFQSIGGVPPDLTLWADQVGVPAKQPRPEMVLQVGHADRILDIASSPDSSTIYTSSQDSTIRVWSPDQKALLRVLTGHAVGTTALALSRNGRWLASGGGMGEVLVHDLANDLARVPIARQPGGGGARVVQVVMLPDGSHFVTVDRKGASFLWDLGKPSLSFAPWIEGTSCLKVVAEGSAGVGAALALCGDGTVRVFNASGAALRTFKDLGGRPTTLAISTDGRLAAIGFDQGRVVVRAIDGEPVLDRYLATGAIVQLVFSASNDLAVGHEQGARLIELAAGHKDGADSELIAGSGLERLSFSPDGRFLAACTRDTGMLKVWKREAGGAVQPIIDEPRAGVLSLRFSSDSRSLITGSKLGSLKRWALEDRDQARGWTVPANRGKIRHITSSPSRRFLVMIDELRQTHLWDLGQRSCRRLSGAWVDGVFLSDETLILAGVAGADQPGRLVRVNPRTMKQDGGFFARTGGDFSIPPDTGFETVALSPDGKRVAASASRFQEPLVCVWETSTGRLTHWIASAALVDPVISLSFTSDAAKLATGGNSPTVKLWDLQGQGAINRAAVTFEDPAGREVAAVGVRPGSSRQLVSGQTDGRLLLWSWADGKTTQRVPSQILAERYFPGPFAAIAFSHDGRYVAAAGAGPMIWLAEMEPRVRPIRDLGTPPHHFEQVNTLEFWPDWSESFRLALLSLMQPGVPVILNPPRPPVLISGSDDTTIKFWDLKRRALMAIFCLASTDAGTPDSPRPIAAREPQWVLYTPDGHFDASPKGRELVRFRQGDLGLRMEQFDSTKLYSFDLTDNLRSGRPLEPASLQQPPPLAIDPPPRNDPKVPQTRLTLSLGSMELKDVRLYHNGVPVSVGLEGAAAPLPERTQIAVRLVPGMNRFYAMASQDGAFDSRSQEVEIVYDGPAEPGRLHVLALGVGGYERERLNFAKRDAEQISKVLHERGIGAGQKRGVRILLTDDQVTAANVTRAFSEIVREVKGNPQDTVVLFLAGHTGVFEEYRFCLLLPHYPFPRESPLLVASRFANPPLAPGATLLPEHLLPLSALTVQLMRLDALNRLVIVDACQAEAILADPQVEAIRKWMEISSRKARTSYLMATRRGEPALEIEPLRHGLFTYTLLRGMGEISPREERPEIARLKLRPNADFDGDGVISIAELDAYAKEVLPPIAELFPQLPDLVVKREAEEVALRGPRSNNADRLDQSLGLQTAPLSFPLIRITQGAKAE